MTYLIACPQHEWGDTHCDGQWTVSVHDDITEIHGRTCTHLAEGLSLLVRADARAAHERRQHPAAVEG